MPLTSRPAADLAARVAQRARGIDSFVGRLEVLATEGRLSRTDIERAYTGAFLSFFTLYERSWEDLFFGLLMGRLTLARPVVPLVSIKSESVARNVVKGGSAFITWFPLDHTLNRAPLYLSQGRPYDRITSIQKGQVTKALTIRNALAHESREALRKFHKSLIGQQLLPKSETRPAGYLRGNHAANQTRLNRVMAELTLVFASLCA